MKIKILHWNVWFQERAENILELVKELNPDIICCQETTVGSNFNDKRDVPKFIAEELGYNYNFSFNLGRIFFYINEGVWNKLFYLGLSIFTIAYIFYQIAEANKDRGRLMLAEMHIKRLGEIDSIKKREKDIQKMLRAIDKLDSLKSVSELEITTDEDLKFMYDQIYVNALETKLKSLKKK